MDFLVFDLKGKFAHFRKFYTNSSSLSYSVPPRTTIEGLIAAILGYERDSYYEILDSQKLNIGLKKLTPTRKIVQSLNYIKATSISHVIKPKEHTQVPFEIVTSEGNLGYRVYVNHIDERIMEDLEDRLKNNRFYYVPYLGVASFNLSLEFKGRFQGKLKFDEDFVEISSIIRKSLIKEGGLDVNIEGIIVKEKMPRDFLKDRIIKEIEDYIFEENGGPLRVKLNSYYYEINDEKIVLM
ncbi:type I-B CRISPR-associated protein Cas5b [Caloramator sp. CAR-1]|uniref:type I-B CRISPR-associated protein Cas5b n=1 Tax=Caloramator sp. CAR-1 TaxID=3062777 RepID=UPI0026E492BA|nr:type I-B CRISPR-associated protein Cas5b [Caloramator sp. CAR-1]MDO6354583.1 type I-B CRISPR-associated protein Cas5b [Caloramator sp. CAR-1]